MRHDLDRLPGQAGSPKIAGEEARDPAGDTDGDQPRRDDRADASAPRRRRALPGHPCRAWTLELGEPGPRTMPALRSRWPPLQRLRLRLRLRLRSPGGPDPVKVLA